MGFRVVDELARRRGVVFRGRWLLKAATAKVEADAETWLLVKPGCFMNRSGDVVQRLARRHRVEPRDVVLAYDDTALDVGRIRVRGRGGAGGHNGVASVVSRLESDEFSRVRVGVGGPAPDKNMVEHVLGPFTGQEEKSITQAVLRAADAVESLLSDGTEVAMNRFNGT